MSQILQKSIGSNRSRPGDFFESKLYLSNGQVFEGYAPGWQAGAYGGEVVFNTGMTGYEESLTDPSYAGQILMFTYPLIGNYGVGSAGTWESNRIQAAGVIVSEAALNYSHEGATRSLLQWLEAEHVPILMGADTRAITRYLRAKGVMTGAISNRAVDFDKLEIPVCEPPITKPVIYNANHKKNIILVDCGAKENIVRSLSGFKAKITRVPSDYDYMSDDYDAVFLSNGPGDPEDYQATINILKKALQRNKPIFGICLGSQLMALAAGATTYKLPYGHRGHNQPCIDILEDRCYITSQNHGYAIDEKSLPKDWQVSFRNLNDNSVEGIAHKSKPFFSVQFHPEACPGPTDTQWLFDKFAELL